MKNIESAFSQILIDANNREWNDIQFYKSLIATLDEYGHDELIPVIEDLIDKHTSMSGQVQQMIEDVDPDTFDKIQQGRDEANSLKESWDMGKLYLDEGIENVAALQPAYAKHIEEHETFVKAREDAEKESKKTAKEITPSEGSTGKKVKNANMKKLKLSEKLFEDLNEEDVEDFNQAVFTAINDVCLDFEFEPSIDDVLEAIDLAAERFETNGIDFETPSIEDDAMVESMSFSEWRDELSQVMGGDSEYFSFETIADQSYENAIEYQEETGKVITPEEWWNSNPDNFFDCSGKEWAYENFPEDFYTDDFDGDEFEEALKLI